MHDPTITVETPAPKRSRGRPRKNAPKVKKTRAQLSAVRRAAGKIGGQRTAGIVSIATLQRNLVREHLDQRLMRATDVMLNGQISLARGQQFLFRIDKKFIETGRSKSGEPRGYWRNEKPVLVTAQYEIEAYLAELAGNNGDISDDKDEGAAYYFITTKEPNMLAIKDAQDRIHGKPRETIEHTGEVKFSLVQLATQRATIDGNADLTVLPADDTPMLAPGVVE